MKRGEIWTLAGGSDYTGKPRPALILQSDEFDVLDSITVCPFTSDLVQAPGFRVLVEAAPENGLDRRSAIMVDKIVTVSRRRLGRRVGLLDEELLSAVGNAAIVFLGLAIAAPAVSDDQ